MTTNRRTAGFSLIEVVVAVGLFAGAIVIILGLFGPLNRSIAEVGDNGRAVRLSGAINAELLRLRDSQAGTAKLDALAALMSSGTVLQLVASTDGSRVVREADAGNDPNSGSPPGIAPRDRYYVVEVRLQSAPLNYTPGTSAFLAVTATVRWPYQLPNGPGAGDVIAADMTQAQSLQFNYALTP